MTSFRTLQLDGALLLFDRSRGLNVRVSTPSTAHLKQRAPRTVMFGITNACNLDCSFCSRDHAASSSWTASSAFEFLSDLAARGVAEVAFGGGEPFVFRDFDVLLERLWNETPLALNVTTNGTLLTKERVARIAPWVGEVRVSIYADNRWEDALRNLAAAGVSRGANVILTRAALPSLESLLHRVAATGCRDVALLRYVGPDSSEQLTRDDELRVEAIIARSPVRLRISTCFGDRFPTLARLVTTGDCGAGEDFLVVTSDRRSKACSFQAKTNAISSAHALVNDWSERRRQRERAPFAGCARPLSGSAERFSGVRAWRAFSSNNSGDCVLVGRFETVESAKTFVERVEAMRTEPFVPQFERTSDSTWYPPEHTLVSAQSVSLHTESAPGDEFRPLRDLLWKLGGVALFHGIHVHERVRILTALGFDSVGQREEAEVALEIDGIRSVGRDATLFIEHEWRQMPRIEQVSARRCSEVTECEEGELERALAMPTPVVDGEWLFVSFDDKDATDRWKLTWRMRVTSTDAVEGARVTAIPGRTIRLRFVCWRASGSAPSVEALERRLKLERVSVEPNWPSTQGSLVPSEPNDAIQQLVAFAREQAARLWIDAEPQHRVAFVLARLKAGVSARAT